MNEATERDFIRKAVASIERTTGQRPHGWLSRYLLTGNTRRLLVEEGFTYHMDDYSDDQPFWNAVDGKPILILPYAIDSNDMKMWTAPSFMPADWLQYACDSFNWLYREGANTPRMMSLGVHLRIIGRPGRIGYFEKFLDHALRHDDVWITTRLQIARHWAQNNPYRRPRRGDQWRNAHLAIPPPALNADRLIEMLNRVNMRASASMAAGYFERRIPHASLASIRSASRSSPVLRV